MNFQALMEGVRGGQNRAVAPAGFVELRFTREVVDAIQQLIRLMADIQQHRACSMAILSGNPSFEERVLILKRKVNARIDYLESLPEWHEVVDPVEWQGILTEWKTVGYGWRRDAILHNFELHCHLIDKIIHTVRNTGKWVMKSRHYSASVADACLSHELLEHAFGRFLLQLEVMARLRGLGTYVAERGADASMLSRLSYVIQCVESEYAQLTAFMATQSHSLFPGDNGTIHCEGMDACFVEWMQHIGQLRRGEVAPSSELSIHVYGLATTVIDGFLHIHNAILASLRIVIDETFESVLEQSLAL